MKNDTQKTEVKSIELVPVKGEAEQLIAMAIDKNIPVESLERLLIMRDKIRAEHAKEKFDQAMSLFQVACPTIEKKTKGYNYKYADLTTIIEQVKNLLAENGFSYTFDTDEAENAVIVYCKVKHIAGHMEVTKAQVAKEINTKMNASQQSGAVMTYGKRYAFINAFGIVTGDEDTDATTRVSNTTYQTPIMTPQMAQKKEEVVTPHTEVKVPSNGNTTAQADYYQGMGDNQLKMAIAKLMSQKKIKEDYEGLNKMSRIERISLLQKTT